jgi:hypothetical protein
VKPVDAPAEWRELVERALAKRADDRFQDARALLAALRARDPSRPSTAQPSAESTGSGSS